MPGLLDEREEFLDEMEAADPNVNENLDIPRMLGFFGPFRQLYSALIIILVFSMLLMIGMIYLPWLMGDQIVKMLGVSEYFGDSVFLRMVVSYTITTALLMIPPQKFLYEHNKTLSFLQALHRVSPVELFFVLCG